MARYFFGDENPVGKRIISSGPGEIEIIGVAKGAKYTSLRERAPHTFYLYYFERPTQSDMTLHLRTGGDPIDYVGTIQRLVREIDPQLQVIDLRTMTDVVDESLMHERFIAQTASAFSLFALLLACVGLYGVISYAVTQRIREIGIRLALGATTGAVLRLILTQGLKLTLSGVALGLAAAFGLTRWMKTVLYGVGTTDPLTFAVVALLLTAVALLACWIPARRATKVDPLVALRCE
jgi:ABC-type antimicrobial peptide transport system permease subunit